MLGTQDAIARMKGKGGSIVNMASIEGLLGEAALPAYNAAKGGVRIFSRSVAIHCARCGYHIRVNNICPGFGETQRVSGALAPLGRHDVETFSPKRMCLSDLGEHETDEEGKEG